MTSARTSNSAAPAAPGMPAEQIPRPLMLSFAMLMLMLVLAALDQTIVSTALPSIARSLQGTARLSWVFSAYLIASTVAVPLYGRLADLHGTRPVLLVAVGLFVTGSALCGLSTGMDALILSRGLQGAGGGGLLTLAMTAVVRSFPPSARGRLQGLLGAVYGLSTMAGPIVGGFIVQHFSWRWAFFINLPLGLLAGLVLALQFPRQAATQRGTMDHLGALLLAGALVCLLLGTRHPVGAAAAAWEGAGFLAAGIGLAAAFVAVQARVAHPLLPLSLFQRRVFSAAIVLSASSGLALFAVVVFTPLYFQTARGLTATASGWHLMPLMAGITLGSVGCGRLLSARGLVRATALAGCAVSGVAFVVLGASVGAPDAPLGLLSACLLPLGIGIGATFPLVTVVAQGAVPMPLMGIATASPVMFRSVAGAMGVSALAWLFEHVLAGGTAPLAFGPALAAVYWAAAAVCGVAALAAAALPAVLVRAPAAGARGG